MVFSASFRRSLACLAWCLTACATSTPSELVVVVESEVAPIDTVHLRVVNESRTVFEQNIATTGEGSTSLPLSFGVTSREGLDTVLSVEASGFVAGRERVRAHARTRFLRHQRRVLRLVFEADCVDTRCESGQTCHDGACADGYVDPETLPRYEGALLDGGLTPIAIDRPDGGARDAGRTDGGANDGGASCGEGDAGTTGAPAGCTLARWPARTTCTGLGSDGAEHWIALVDPRFDQSGEQWRILGYDVDGVCTNPLEASPASECVTPGGPAVADGVDGRDNAVGAAISAQLLSFFPDFATSMMAQTREGRLATVVRITGWNGMPDDDRVDVWIANALDVVPSDYALAPGPVDIDAIRPDPRWDGTDRAVLSRSYFAGGMLDRPLARDDNAYVSGGVLVARMPDRVPIDMPTVRGTARLQLTDTRLVAQLAPEGDRFDGATLVGRMSTTDIVGFATGLGLCGGTTVLDTYIAAFRALVDRTLDVRSLPGSGGAEVDCDALTLVLPFLSSYPVTFERIDETDIAPTGCL